MEELKSARRKEWREQQVQISQAAAAAIQLKGMLERTRQDDDVYEIMQRMHFRKCTEMKQGVLQTLTHVNAFKHLYLRNYMYAEFVFQNSRCEPFENVWLPAFQHPYWEDLKRNFAEHIDKVECIKQVILGRLLDEYMNCLTAYYRTTLANLADGGLRCTKNRTSEGFNELLQLHRKAEIEGLFDEIFVIRTMLIAMVLSAVPDLLFDEMAARVFQFKAGELLDEMNNRRVTPLESESGRSDSMTTSLRCKRTIFDQ